MVKYNLLLALGAFGTTTAFIPHGKVTKAPRSVATNLVSYRGDLMLDDRPRSFNSPYYGGDFFSGGYGMGRFRNPNEVISPSQGSYSGFDTVQGGSLKTYSFGDFVGETVEVEVTTDNSSPIDCNIDLWEGPNFSPVKIKAFSQDGSTHPVTAQMFLAPYESSSVAVRNTGPIEFPSYTRVQGIGNDSEIRRLCLQSLGNRDARVQGGAQQTFQLGPGNNRAGVLLRTEGRPLNARIEVLQGPNNNKMTLDVYSHDGVESPIFLSMDTMGRGNAIRIINLSSVEFPLNAVVEAFGMDGRGMRPQGMGNSFGYDRYSGAGEYGDWDRYGRSSSYGSGMYSNNSGLNGRYGSGYGLGSPYVNDYSSYDSSYGRGRIGSGGYSDGGRYQGGNNVLDRHRSNFMNSMSSRYWY